MIPARKTARLPAFPPRIGLRWALAAGALCIAGFVLAQAGNTRTARAVLQDTSGRTVGTALLEETADGLRLTVRAEGRANLTPGARGLHVHANGDCREGPDAQTGEIIPFGAAGGHFDPMSTRNHGKPEDSPETAHTGDLPALEIGADGSGTLEFSTRKMTLADARNGILGRSLVLHENPDDYSTDPAGGTGGRIACGVILAPSQSLQARYVVPGANTFPEGITFDAQRNTVYTGSSSNGTIYRLPLGSSQAEVLSLGGSPGRKAALGMRIDSRGRLLVAGGAEGTVAAVSTTDGQTLAVMRTPPSPQAFVNDLTVSSDGFVYVTDSFRPVLWRFRDTTTPPAQMERWLDLSRTPIRYRDGVNLNGIVSSPDGRTLLAVQTNTGQLWRIGTRNQAVREVDLGGAKMTGGDGLVLSGDTLYVIRNAQGRVDALRLDPDRSIARPERSIVDANLRFPTTAVLAANRFLVVNAQLDKQKSAPVLPFVVTSHSAP